MLRVFITLTVIFFTYRISAQDTVNHMNSARRKEGFWRKVDAEGHKIYEGHFTNGIPSGEFRYYYKDGTLKTLSHLSMNGKKARTVSYYPGGKKMAAGNYVDEKKDSLWQFFNEYDGGKVSEEFYRDDKIDGKSTVYFPDGAVSEIKTYSKGIPDGSWEQFFTDGKPKLRGFYKAGEKDGSFKNFFPTGSIMISGHYADGHMDGEWLYYDDKGQVIKRETYKTGKLLKVVPPDKK